LDKQVKHFIEKQINKIIKILNLKKSTQQNIRRIPIRQEKYSTPLNTQRLYSLGGVVKLILGMPKINGIIMKVG
jgi:hypothetical protein